MHVRVIGVGPRAGAAMQHDGRMAFGVTVHLVIDAMHWGDLQVPTLVWAGGLGIQSSQQPSAFGVSFCTPKTPVK